MDTGTKKSTIIVTSAAYCVEFNREIYKKYKWN